MTGTLNEQEHFLSHLEQLFEQVVSTDALQKVRMRAWDHFLEMGLPAPRDEIFRYVRLRNFYAKRYTLSYPTQIDLQVIKQAVLPECQRSYLVLINGHFRPELSRIEDLPKQVVISHLNGATRTYGTFLNNHWAKAMKEEMDAFAIANAALHRDGLFIYISPKAVIECPIQVLHLLDGQESAMWMMPRLQVVLGAHSQAELIFQQQHHSGEHYALNGVLDLALEDQAHLSMTQTATNLPSQVWGFEALRATLKRSASLKTHLFTEGAEGLRYDYRIQMAGEGSSAALQAAWMLADKRECHHHVLIDHQAPNCQSRQLFKGILRDSSRSSFEGKIYVRPEAQKTDAFQLNNNLLLSDLAHADSKPNLEIFADDVKASHGATVGQLDSQELLYLKTRGLTHDQATNLLIDGFCREVVDQIAVPSIRHQLQQRIHRYVS